MAIDYRGIITKGYHVDAGGQDRLRIITQGYISVLAELISIINTIAKDLLFARNLNIERLFVNALGKENYHTKTLQKEIRI